MTHSSPPPPPPPRPTPVTVFPPFFFAFLNLSSSFLCVFLQVFSVSSVVWPCVSSCCLPYWLLVNWWCGDVLLFDHLLEPFLTLCPPSKWSEWQCSSLPITDIGIVCLSLGLCLPLSVCLFDWFTDRLANYICLSFIDRLVGLVVKASTSRAGDPGFKSCFCQDFFRGRVIPVT